MPPVIGPTTGINQQPQSLSRLLESADKRDARTQIPCGVNSISGWASNDNHHISNATAMHLMRPLFLLVSTLISSY
jgi:hypothetical protein